MRFWRLKIAVCLYVRDEQDQLAEWLAYQHVIGADTCIIYDNLSVDGTVDVARRMGRRQDVRIVDWPDTNIDSQRDSYKDCIKRFGREFDWIAFFDSDEFLVLKKHKSLKALVSARKDCSAILINWAMFGSSGHADRPPGLTIDNFTRRADYAFSPNLHVKSIIRPRDYINMNNAHHARVTGRSCHADGTTCVRPAPGVSTFTQHDVCQVNHYFVRSRAQWEKKRARGYRGEDPRPDQTFNEYDRNEVIDTSARAYSEKVKRHMRAAGFDDSR